MKIGFTLTLFFTLLLVIVVVLFRDNSYSNDSSIMNRKQSTKDISNADEIIIISSSSSSSQSKATTKRRKKTMMNNNKNNNNNNKKIVKEQNSENSFSSSSSSDSVIKNKNDDDVVVPSLSSLSPPSSSIVSQKNQKLVGIEQQQQEIEIEQEEEVIDETTITSEYLLQNYDRVDWTPRDCPNISITYTNNTPATTTTSTNSSQSENKEEKQETQKETPYYFSRRYTAQQQRNYEQNQTQHCPVLIYLPSTDCDFYRVPQYIYDFGICFALRFVPDGNFYRKSTIMDGYHLDYTLAETLKRHPCRLNMSKHSYLASSREAFDEFEKKHNTRIIGFIPALFPTTSIMMFEKESKSKMRGSFNTARGMFKFFAGANNNRPDTPGFFYTTLARRNRWYVFYPAFVRPPPIFKTLRPYGQLSTITNEVGLKYVKPKVLRLVRRANGTGAVVGTEDLSVFWKLHVNLRQICSRHVVVPKVDWSFSEKFLVKLNELWWKAKHSGDGGTTNAISGASISSSSSNFEDNKKRKNKNNNNNNKNNKNKRKILHFIYFAGRSATLERERLRKVALQFPDEIVYRDPVLSPGPQTSNILKTGGYRSEMQQSLFCIDTTGDDLTTRRITTAVLSGCIPLLICDDCVFPYPKLFSYQISDSYEDIVRDVLVDENEADDYVYKKRKYDDDYDIISNYKNNKNNNNDNDNNNSSSSVLLTKLLPSFFIRLRQYPLESDLYGGLMMTENKFDRLPETNVLKIMRKVRSDKKLIRQLQKNVQKAKSLFYSMFDPRSRFVDAMLLEMRRSLEPPYYTDIAYERGKCVI